jgi:large subunit ribosomal protein L21
MFAIVNIRGKQYKVTENQKLFVPRLKDEIGAKVTFSDVLMIERENNKFEIGAPVISSINIEATVLDHVKDDKVIVFKKKRRKQYRRTRGHRQQYTQIEINKIA